MHEINILKSIFKYLEEVEKTSSQKVKKIHISLSEFGGIQKEHFLQHYKEESFGTKWESVGVDVKKTAHGPELEITKIDFE